jgi:glycosyltransferase involved in cell wall biosynthesis
LFLRIFYIYKKDWKKALIWRPPNNKQKKMPKLIRITTVPMSLQYLLRGQLPFMQDNGFEVLAVSANGPERQAILDDGIKHIIIPFTRKITPLQDLRCLFLLIALFHHIKPDIVHTHTPKAGLLGMLAAWICSVPVRMHTVAGLPVMEAQGMKRWILMMTEKITYACASRVYPNSEGLREYIVNQLAISNEQLTIIGKGSSNGIDTAFFSKSAELLTQASQIRLRYGTPEDAVVFSFVGRVVKDKGMHELVQAFRNVLSQRTDVYLMIVGPLEPELDPLDPEDLNFLQTNKQVIMAGFQRDVRPWLLASDVFVFPSYREGFPNVVMQACCLEVPCIVSDINGCNEIIKHEETGLVVKPKDHEALEKAMLKLKINRNFREGFKKRAREFVVMNYDQRFVWKELVKEYERQLVIRN